MTATTARRRAEPADRSGPPALQGVSHLSLSVPDLAAATHFWTGVMGFEVLGEGPGFRFTLHRTARLAIVVADHVALAVSDLPALREWERWLVACGVPYTPITASEAAHHLNLRAPGDIPVELCVLKAEFLAALELDSPVAGTH